MQCIKTNCCKLYAHAIYFEDGKYIIFALKDRSSEHGLSMCHFAHNGGAWIEWMLSNCCFV